MQDHQPALEAAIAASATKAMYGGGAGAFAGFAVSNELLGLMGLLIALAGFAVNTYYRRKQDAREQAEHERRMRMIQTEAGGLAE